jgi:hypothetical protein
MMFMIKGSPILPTTMAAVEIKGRITSSTQKLWDTGARSLEGRVHID